MSGSPRHTPSPASPQRRPSDLYPGRTSQTPSLDQQHHRGHLSGKTELQVSGEADWSTQLRSLGSLGPPCLGAPPTSPLLPERGSRHSLVTQHRRPDLVATKTGVIADVGSHTSSSSQRPCRRLHRRRRLIRTGICLLLTFRVSLDGMSRPYSSQQPSAQSNDSDLRFRDSRRLGGPAGIPPPTSRTISSLLHRQHSFSGLRREGQHQVSRRARHHRRHLGLPGFARHQGHFPLGAL